MIRCVREPKFDRITRLASKEIFSPSNKIHREVCRAKDLSAHRYTADTGGIYTPDEGHVANVR